MGEALAAEEEGGDWRDLNKPFAVCIVGIFVNPSSPQYNKEYNTPSLDSHGATRMGGLGALDRCLALIFVLSFIHSFFQSFVPF